MPMNAIEKILARHSEQDVVAPRRRRHGRR